MNITALADLCCRAAQAKAVRKLEAWKAARWPITWGFHRLMDSCTEPTEAHYAACRKPQEGAASDAVLWRVFKSHNAMEM